MKSRQDDLMAVPFAPRSPRKARPQGPAEAVSRYQSPFEHFLAGLSARFTAISEDAIDAQIDPWLKQLVDLTDCDAGAMAEVSLDGAAEITHCYATASAPPFPLGPIGESAMPWLMSQLNAQAGSWSLQSLRSLTDEAVAECGFLRSIGVKSVIALPVGVGGAPVCVMILANICRARTWTGEEASQLRLVGEVFANAISRRRARQRLDQKQQELSHMGRVAAMGELASVIAHELDQPLMAVINNAETARYLLQADEIDRDEADDALKDVVASVMRVAEIVRRERSLLRKSGRSHEDFSLNGAIREIGIFIRAEARQCGARVRLDLFSGLPPIRGDRVQLQQVVLNLARNGLQAMNTQAPAMRELAIRTAVAGEEILVSVTDNGPAIEESHLRRMFEPFYTTKPNGLGMGLSISKSIVDAHRGKLWATRNDGGGVTLQVSIPRT